MTNAEKAKRYDALQSAIKLTIAMYRERRRHSLNHSKENRGSIISAYDYGTSETYKAVIEDLERWTK